MSDRTDVELTVADLRPEVARFAILMEQKLRENDHKGRYSHHRGDGRGWAKCPLDYLVRRLRQEYEELRRALERCPPSQKREDDFDRATSVFDARVNVAREAADVANFAMMIADVYGEMQT